MSQQNQGGQSGGQQQPGQQTPKPGQADLQGGQGGKNQPVITNRNLNERRPQTSARLRRGFFYFNLLPVKIAAKPINAPKMPTTPGVHIMTRSRRILFSALISALSLLMPASVRRTYPSSSRSHIPGSLAAGYGTMSRFDFRIRYSV